MEGQTGGSTRIYNHHWRRREIRLPKEIYIPLAKVDTELLSTFEMSPIRVYHANKYLAYQYSRLAKARKNWDLKLYWRISRALL